MAKVEFEVPAHHLRRGQRAVTFYVTGNDDQAVGTLYISHGKLEWMPKSSKSRGRCLTWEQFSDLIVEHGWKP